MINIQGILFDKDGVLLDFQATWGRWFGQILPLLAEGDDDRAARMVQAAGFEPDHARFRRDSRVIAGTAAEVEALICAELPVAAHPRALRLMREGVDTAELVLTADLPPLMAHLRAQGLAIGLATNDTEGAARAHLAQAGTLEAFDFIAGSDSGHGAKPAPGMCLAFSQALGLAPGACVMVGDSTHDLDAGRAAGFQTVAVLTGVAEAPDLAPGADVVLDSVANLPAWLGTG